MSWRLLLVVVSCFVVIGCRQDGSSGSVGSVDTLDGIIEVPELDLTIVHTTVYVPSREELLHGGSTLQIPKTVVRD